MWGVPPVPWPVAGLLAFASWEGGDEFLEPAASFTPTARGSQTLSCGPGRDNDGAPLREETPTTEKTSPGASKCSDPGLVTRGGSKRGIQLA